MLEDQKCFTESKWAAGRLVGQGGFKQDKSDAWSESHHRTLDEREGGGEHGLQDIRQDGGAGAQDVPYQEQRTLGDRQTEGQDRGSRLGIHCVVI